MRVLFAVPSVILLAALAACAPTPAPVATTNAPNASSQMPQSTNSMPAGGTVNAPLTTNRGTVSTTTVGPRY